MTAGGLLIAVPAQHGLPLGVHGGGDNEQCGGLALQLLQPCQLCRRGGRWDGRGDDGGCGGRHHPLEGQAAAVILRQGSLFKNTKLRPWASRWSLGLLAVDLAHKHGGNKEHAVEYDHRMMGKTIHHRLQILRKDKAQHL